MRSGEVFHGMELRTFVSFEWSVAASDQLGPGGEVIVPAGRSIMETLRSEMAKSGFEITDVEQHESYGWSFETRVDGTRVWSMLQFSEPWLLITDAPVSWLGKLKGRNNEPLSKVCAGLSQCLRNLPLASKVQWFTRKEFQQSGGQGGAAAP